MTVWTNTSKTIRSLFKFVWITVVKYWQNKSLPACRPPSVSVSSQQRRLRRTHTRSLTLCWLVCDNGAESPRCSLETHGGYRSASIRAEFIGACWRAKPRRHRAMRRLIDVRVSYQLAESLKAASAFPNSGLRLMSAILSRHSFPYDCQPQSLFTGPRLYGGGGGAQIYCAD